MPDRIVTKLVIDMDGVLTAFGLDIKEVSDTIERAIIVHELPYRNGAVLEDLGSLARIVNVTCAFYQNTAPRSGEELAPTYTAHLLFVKALQNQSVVEFHHPKYGVMKGKVRNVGVTNDSRDEYAEVRFEFIEQVVDVDKKPAFEVVSAVNREFRNAQVSQLASIKESVKASLSASNAIQVLDQAIDFTQDMADQVTGVSNAAREYIKAVDTVIGKFDSILSNITQPVKSILGTIDYTADLPGKLLRSTAQCAERFQALYAGLEDSPVTYVQSFMSGMQSVQTAFAGYAQETLAVDQVKALKAQFGCILGAKVFAADEKNRDALKGKEKARAFDAAGNFTGTLVASNIMTVTAIERVLYDIKVAAQASIDVSRENRGLKAEVGALQDSVNNIKLERLRIKQVTITNMPLHVVCLQNNLSYQAAERILKLNKNIRNPTFVEGTIDIYGS